MKCASSAPAVLLTRAADSIPQRGTTEWHMFDPEEINLSCTIAGEVSGPQQGDRHTQGEHFPVPRSVMFLRGLSGSLAVEHFSALLWTA